MSRNVKLVDVRGLIPGCWT